MDKMLTFKLDTGADVTAVSQANFKCIFGGAEWPVLQKPEKPLLGPGRVPLKVLGFTRLQLKSGFKQTTEKVYVVRNFSTPLLGLPAIIALGLLLRVNSMTMDILKAAYPMLCSELGNVQRAYNIKLKANAVPFSLKAPRRIPISLYGQS